jgi:acetyltransferase-like isoleucine patch superfamily enzyme
MIVPRKRIGAWSIIGAGAVIINDIPPGSVVVGNPGKVIKTKNIPFLSGDPFSDGN